MSQRVQKLEALLSRVRERREAPRVRAVAPVPAAAPAPVVAEKSLERVVQASPITERISRPAAPTPLEDAMSELTPTPMAPAPVPSPRMPRPPSDEFSLDIEPVRPSRAPEKKRVEPPPAAKAPAPPPADEFEDMFASRPPPAAPKPVAAPAPAAAPVPVQVAAPAPAPIPVAQPAPAPTPITAPSARVAPEAPVASAPVAKAVSPVRTEAPNTFGELLERTLSLRPR